MIMIENMNDKRKDERLLELKDLMKVFNDTIEESQKDKENYWFT